MVFLSKAETHPWSDQTTSNLVGVTFWNEVGKFHLKNQFLDPPKNVGGRNDSPFGVFFISKILQIAFFSDLYDFFGAWNDSLVYLQDEFP